MIVQATGIATLTHEQGRVILHVPSGKDTLDVSLTINQALGLAHTLPSAVNGAIMAPGGLTAEVIKFPTKRSRTTTANSHGSSWRLSYI